MIQADNRTLWQRRLQADIDLIRQSKIRPLSILRRLEEIMDGTHRSADWRDFRVPCRGKSYQDIEGNKHTVCLEFHNSAEAKKVHGQLMRLKDQYQIIEEITYFYYPHKGYVSVNLRFQVFAE